jgi:chemotaxis protein CheZ
MMDAGHKTQLLESARALIAALEADNEPDAEVQLTALAEGRDNNLFIEVGKLTRDLHAAISNFSVDSRIANLTEHDIPDSRDRLDYVVTLTEQAAHQTLEAVDKAIPAANNLLELTKTVPKTADAATQLSIDDVFLSITQRTHTIQSALSDITMAQGFQDLTGQVIRKVTDLIEEVETNLVRLIKIAAEHQPQKQVSPIVQEVDPLKAEGPQMNAAHKKNVVTDQDDVDDLLSSLGF